jgi:hypothetical protein
MKYLDLDDSNTWVEDLFQLVSENDTWEYILNSKVDSYSGGKILEHLSYKEESMYDQVLLNLVRKAKNVLVSKYSFVIGYHGCRVTDKESYLKNGIMTSNPRKLIKFTKELFGLDKEIDEIVDEFNKDDYLSHNANKIGFLLSAEWAKYERNQHSLGSELIRAIAGRLGKKYLEKYFKIGTSTLIKCKIPIDWLDTYSTYPIIKSYSSSVLYQIIYKKFWPADKNQQVNGGFMFRHNIPPEYIIDFIDMTGYNDEEAFIN